MKFSVSKASDPVDVHGKSVEFSTLEELKAFSEKSGGCELILKFSSNKTDPNEITIYDARVE